MCNAMSKWLNGSMIQWIYPAGAQWLNESIDRSRGGPIHNANIAPSAKPCKMISGWTFKWTRGVKMGRKYTSPSIVPGAATVAAQNPSTM